MSFVNIKTIILIGIAVILILVIKNIATSIITLRQNSHIVTNLRLQEEEAKRKRLFLQQQLKYVDTKEFIEKQAREKLGMVKPGEHIVIAPVITKSPDPTPDNTPTWKKWWNLFF